MRYVICALLLVVALQSCKKMDRTSEQPGGQPPQAAMKTPEQIAVLKEILQKNPDNVSGWISLGNTLMDSSMFADAVQAYAKALALDPKNVDVRVDMGTCLRGTGKSTQAVEEYRKAIAINPAHPNAHLNLAVVLAMDIKDRAQAIKEFETYLKLVPNAPNAGQVMQTIADLKAGKL